MSKVAGSIAVAVALVAAGGTAARAVVLPAPEELVPNTVALVSSVPVEVGTITVAEFRHALVLTAIQKGRRSAPKPGGRGYERLEAATLRSLLEAVWIRGEAAEMGIAITPTEVSRQLAQIKKENFTSRAEYHEFLREAHYTRRDVNERVELQLLGMRLQMRLQTRIEREARNEFEENQAFKEFVAEFNERWRGRTVCAPEYATNLCSNGPPLADARRASSPAGSPLPALHGAPAVEG